MHYRNSSQDGLQRPQQPFSLFPWARYPAWLYRLNDGVVLTLPEILQSQRDIAHDVGNGGPALVEDMPMTIYWIITGATWYGGKPHFSEFTVY